MELSRRAFLKGTAGAAGAVVAAGFLPTLLVQPAAAIAPEALVLPPLVPGVYYNSMPLVFYGSAEPQEIRWSAAMAQSSEDYEPGPSAAILRAKERTRIMAKSHADIHDHRRARQEAVWSEWADIHQIGVSCHEA